MWFAKKQPEPEAPFFAWSAPEHAVGVADLDQEHRQLAKQLNEIHAALRRSQDRLQALRLMEALLAATRTHFTHEEQVMAEAGYGGLEAHATEHQSLLRQARELIVSYQGGTVSAMAMANLLKAWLVPHIHGMDREFSACLRRQGFR